MLSVICREGTTSTQKKTSHKGSEKTHVYLLICVVLKKELDPIHTTWISCFLLFFGPSCTPPIPNHPIGSFVVQRLRAIGQLLPWPSQHRPASPAAFRAAPGGSGITSSEGWKWEDLELRRLYIYIYIYLPGFPKWFWLTGFFHCQRRQPSFWRVELNPQNRGSQTGSRFLRYTPEV